MAYHHGNLREALIDAAVQIVSEEGPDALSVRQVARLAGVSSGAPFRHFADKSALMAAVAEDGIAKLAAAMAERIAEVGDDPADQFQAMGVAYVQFAVRHRGHFRVMNRPEYESARIIEGWELARAQMRSLIERGQAEGVIREGDVDAMIMTAQALVYGVARMFVDGLYALEGIDDARAEEIAMLITDQLRPGMTG